MAIVQTIDNVSQFRGEFRKMDRHGNFSYEGMQVLFDYLDELSNDIGEPVELDVMALCWEYSEDTLQEIAENYRIDTSEIDPEDEDALRDCVRDYLEYYTSIAGETADGFVYAVF